MSSSNSRVLLYFLSTLNTTLKISLGLRGRSLPSLSAIVKNCDNSIENKRKSKIFKRKSEDFTSYRKLRNSLSKVSSKEAYERSYMVIEGLRQYTNYVIQNNVRSVIMKRNISSGIVTDGETIRTVKSEPIKTVVIDSERKTLENSDKNGDIQKHLHNPVENENTILKKNVDDHFSNSVAPSVTHVLPKQTLSKRSKEKKVPSSRIGRFVSYGGLAASLGMGAITEVTKRTFGFGNESKDSVLASNPLLTEANANRIVETLCKVRGAALKIGQMFSIFDNTMISPQLQAIFERVRQSADFMPKWQMERVMKHELGYDWKDKFQSFEVTPFAAASIGQVHRGITKDGTEVAIKIQYPGVAEGIESDIRNLLTVLKIGNILPEGLFVENIARYARKELAWECDYIREAKCARTFRDIVINHMSGDGFYVPKVIDNLSTQKVLTSEMINGISIDKLDTIKEMNQRIKNDAARRILKLTLKEVFEFRYMQTDPNWSNFYYDPNTNVISLLDFGATREYSKEFIDKYMSVMIAAANQDKDAILKSSLDIGFLTGFESKLFERAHVDSVMILGEPFSTDEFSFANEETIRRIQELLPVMLQYRLTPPPEEIYSLHRKMSGVFLMFTKLKVNMNCKEIFDDIRSRYDK